MNFASASTDDTFHGHFLSTTCPSVQIFLLITPSLLTLPIFHSWTNIHSCPLPRFLHRRNLVHRSSRTHLWGMLLFFCLIKFFLGNTIEPRLRTEKWKNKLFLHIPQYARTWKLHPLDFQQTPRKLKRRYMLSKHIRWKVVRNLLWYQTIEIFPWVCSWVTCKDRSSSTNLKYSPPCTSAIAAIANLNARLNTFLKIQTLCKRLHGLQWIAGIVWIDYAVIAVA